MEKKMKSKIEIKLTEGERDILYFYLLGVYSLEYIETFEEYPAVVDRLEESITEVAKSTRRRRGVKSKMKKLERVKPLALMGMMGEVAPQWVAKELNKIIDHLNSQDQEEENTVCEGCGKTITSRFMQSYTKGDGMHSYCLSCDPEKQDTPGELIKRKLKEITTSERVGFLYAVGDDDLLANELYDYIQQLLEERETFTKGELNNLLDWIENGYVPSIEARDEIDKGIIEKVVKLLNKK